MIPNMITELTKAQLDISSEPEYSSQMRFSSDHHHEISSERGNHSLSHHHPHHHSQSIPFTRLSTQHTSYSPQSAINLYNVECISEDLLKGVNRKAHEPGNEKTLGNISNEVDPIHGHRVQPTNYKQKIPCSLSISAVHAPSKKNVVVKHHRKTFQSNAHDNSDEFIGVLTIILEGAKGLIMYDKSKHPDPYVVFSLGSQIEKSSVVESTSFPLWDEKFMLPWDGHSSLRIECFSKAHLLAHSKPQRLGFVEVDLLKSTEAGNFKHFRDLPLINTLAFSHGSISFAVKIVLLDHLL